MASDIPDEYMGEIKIYLKIQGYGELEWSLLLQKFILSSTIINPLYIIIRFLTHILSSIN